MSWTKVFFLFCFVFFVKLLLNIELIFVSNNLLRWISLCTEHCSCICTCLFDIATSPDSETLKVSVKLLKCYRYSVDFPLVNYTHKVLPNEHTQASVNNIFVASSKLGCVSSGSVSTKV